MQSRKSIVFVCSCLLALCGCASPLPQVVSLEAPPLRVEKREPNLVKRLLTVLPPSDPASAPTQP